MDTKNTGERDTTGRAKQMLTLGNKLAQTLKRESDIKKEADTLSPTMNNSRNNVIHFYNGLG